MRPATARSRHPTGRHFPKMKPRVIALADRLGHRVPELSQRAVDAWLDPSVCGDFFRKNQYRFNLQPLPMLLPPPGDVSRRVARSELRQ